MAAASTPTDLTLYPGKDIALRLIGGTFADKPEFFREASAITYVTSDHGLGEDAAIDFLNSVLR